MARSPIVRRDAGPSTNHSRAVADHGGGGPGRFNSPPAQTALRGYWVTNFTLSMRSSTVQVPEPLLELTCHCTPTIWLAVAIREPAGLLNEVNRAVKVVAV